MAIASFKVTEGTVRY